MADPSLPDLWLIPPFQSGKKCWQGKVVNMPKLTEAEEVPKKTGRATRAWERIEDGIYKRTGKTGKPLMMVEASTPRILERHR